MNIEIGEPENGNGRKKDNVFDIADWQEDRNKGSEPSVAPSLSPGAHVSENIAKLPREKKLEKLKEAYEETAKMVIQMLEDRTVNTKQAALSLQDQVVVLWFMANDLMPGDETIDRTWLDKTHAACQKFIESLPPETAT